MNPYEYFFTFCSCCLMASQQRSLAIFSVSTPFSEAYADACQDTPNLAISRPDMPSVKCAISEQKAE